MCPAEKTTCWLVSQSAAHFDLLLQALDLPTGAEVLFSAITVPDMVRVALAHGLVPVPVDVCGSDFHLDLKSLRRAITEKSKLLVVAHLFGARPDMMAAYETAHAKDLFVVEDCAQAWGGPDWRGRGRADATLFSFGVIKTATAFGGAGAGPRPRQAAADANAGDSIHLPCAVAAQIWFSVAQVRTAQSVFDPNRVWRARHPVRDERRRRCKLSHAGVSGR